MTFTSIVFNVLLAVCAGWLMALPRQPMTARLITTMIIAGATTNLAEWIWYGYVDLWPGELLVNGGSAAYLARSIYLQEPARSSGDEGG